MALNSEDKIEIMELISKAAHYYHVQDWDKLAAVYTPDIVTIMEGFDLQYVGIDAQVEHAKESARQTDGKDRDYCFNFFIEEEAGGARVNFTFINFNAGSAPMECKIVASGRHSDSVVKTPDGWRIALCRLTFDQKFDLDF